MWRSQFCLIRKLHWCREVEPPRKRFIQASNQALFQNSGPTRTADRVVQNGVARPLLSNEQIQQFITSTVLPNGHPVTSTETVNPNVTSCTVYPSLPGNRMQQQTGLTNVQPQLTLNDLRSGQTLPWVSIQQQTQETALQKQTEYIDQSTVQQLVFNSQGNIHLSAQNAFVVQFLHPPTLSHAGQQQPISANHLILPPSVEAQGSTPTIVPNEYVLVKGQQVPTNIISVPSVTGVYDQTIQLPPQAINGIRSNCYYNGANVVTSTPKVATTGMSADFHQRCSAAQHQLETWSLRPQSVPSFEAPMEAQTKTKTKKPKKKTTANVSQRQNANADMDKCVLYNGSNMAKGSKGLAKIDVRSVQQTTEKQKEANLHQTQNSASTSSLKGGKKGVKRIVVPLKVHTDPVEYPPYVARIMRILNRQKQGQVESSDDNKKSFNSTPKQMTTTGKDIKERADSTPKQCITDKKSMNSVDFTVNQNEPQSLRCNESSQNVVSRTAVPSKQPVLEQKIQHKSLSDTVKKANAGCTQLKSGCRNEPMSIRKTLLEDYRPVVNTALLLDDLSPDSCTLLEADSFYGPEILVTSGSHCFVASVPFS